MGRGAAERLPAVRVRRPGGNQPQQLREPAISPNSNPSGGTQEQVFRRSVRESVSAPGLLSPTSPAWLLPPGVQRKAGRAGTCICLSGNCSWKPRGACPHVSGVPRPPLSQSLSGDTRWPSLAQSAGPSLRLGRAAPERGRAGGRARWAVAVPALVHPRAAPSLAPFMFANRNGQHRPPHSTQWMCLPHSP